MQEFNKENYKKKDISILRGQCLNLAFQHLIKVNKEGDATKLFEKAREYFDEGIAQGYITWMDKTEHFNTQEYTEKRETAPVKLKEGITEWVRKDGTKAYLDSRWKLCEKCDKIIPVNKELDKHICNGEKNDHK